MGYSITSHFCFIFIFIFRTILALVHLNSPPHTRNCISIHNDLLTLLYQGHILTMDRHSRRSSNNASLTSLFGKSRLTKKSSDSPTSPPSHKKRAQRRCSMRQSLPKNACRSWLARKRQNRFLYFLRRLLRKINQTRIVSLSTGTGRKKNG